jgi:uncharacterized protein
VFRFIILFSFLILLGIFLYTWYKFRKSIYLHTILNQQLIHKFPIDHQNLTLKTADGLKISAWYIPVNQPKAMIILVPGYTNKNGGKAMMLPHAKYLKENGYSTLLLDLRSTGESTGNKIALGIKEWQDLEAAYDYLIKLPENKNLKIGYFGISMGGATSIICAGITGKSDFVIASVPYASFDKQFENEIKRNHLNVPIFLPVIKFLAKIEFGFDYESYNPEYLIKQIHQPILIFAAKKDNYTGYYQAESLYNLANNPKQYWLSDTGHDIHLEKPLEFEKRVLDFLGKIIK